MNRDSSPAGFLGTEPGIWKLFNRDRLHTLSRRSAGRDSVAAFQREGCENVGNLTQFADRGIIVHCECQRCDRQAGSASRIDWVMLRPAKESLLHPAKLGA